MCQYLTEHCNSIRYIHLRYYYCTNLTNPLLSNILLWIFVFCTIGILFLVLGLLASDYLVPNLSALSETLKMDDKLSGLTLLAFANGAPDILSTFIAMKSDMTTLAIGELLGSANFALTIVIGVLAMYKPFKVNHQTFIRDLVIFSILFLFCLYILSDGVIDIKESIILCILYVVFIALSLFLPQGEIQEVIPDENNNGYISTNDNNNNNTDRQSVVSNASSSSLNDYYSAQNIDNLERGMSYKIALLDSLKLAWLWQKKVSNKAQIPTLNNDLEQMNPIDETTSLTSSQHLEINVNAPDDIEDTRNVEVGTNSTNSYYPGYNSSYTNHIINNLKGLKENNRSGEDFQILYPSKQRSESPISSIQNKSLNSISNKNTNKNTNTNANTNTAINYLSPPRNDTPVISIESCDAENDGHKEEHIVNKDSETLLIPKSVKLNSVDNLLVPPSTYQPSQEVLIPLMRQVSSSSLLIPYVEYQKTNNIFVKICPLHIITGSESIIEKIIAILLLPVSTLANLLIPIPLPTELEGEMYIHELSLSIKLFYFQIAVLPLIIFDFQFSIYIILFTIILPIIILGIKFYFQNFFKIIFPILSSIVGFLSVLKLISLTASVIISILKDLAEIYQLNESILGLTILSLGNSVGDVVTNLALAGLGRPLTGLHACFGSPLLYLLFGIGSCSLIVQIFINDSKAITFQIDQSLKLTAISIVSMLILYGIIVPLNNWMFKKWMGYIGVVVWFTITSVNFVLHRHRY
ncbi:hypothetical protein C6P40_000601 [Pichia californica]|uniref:Sodium/calcium exchanger membrane region domain-containing protein n=1 Tax=Pichia californica TaxID=460514 RepID=A0A9P6WN18_9ASCO|nr:hypothetical protein C6P40_000601 [[Candida] californica]